MTLTHKKHIVYALADSRTGETKYIGRSDNEARRRAQHAQEAAAPGPNQSGDGRLAWFRELRNAGAEPRFVVLERYASRAQAVHGETRCIKRALAAGCQLVNVVGNARHKRPEPKSFLLAVGGELRARVEAEAARSNMPAKKMALQALSFGMDALEAVRTEVAR